MKKGIYRWALGWIGICAVISILAPIIATQTPWRIIYNNQNYYPLVYNLTGWGRVIPDASLQLDWHQLGQENLWMAPIPFDPTRPDHSESETNSKHWLGKDEAGRDIASQLIHGTRTALGIGIGACLISVFLGLILGGLAGYLGDRGWMASRAQLLLGIFGMLLGIFYIFFTPFLTLLELDVPWILNGLLSVGIFTVFPILGIKFANVFHYFPFWKKTIHIPIDFIISRLIEIKHAFPTLFLVLAIMAIIPGGEGWLAIILGITGWTPFARLIRAEMLQIKTLDYMTAGKALGYSPGRLLFKHAIPNALGPVWSMVGFSIAGSILAESALSFIRDDPDQISWGAILASARHHPEAWGLAVWPGLALFFTLYAFQLLGEAARNKWNPRMRNIP